MRSLLLVSPILLVVACGSDRPGYSADTSNPVIVPDPMEDRAPFHPSNVSGPITHPDFGQPAVSLDKAPPALGPATIGVTADGSIAVATDTDRDRLIIAKMETGAIRTVAFAENDEPGRFALEEESRRAHVVLRRSGQVATVDLETGTLLEKRFVCTAPQGIARDNGVAFVVCSDGEVMSLPLSLGSPATQLTKIADGDLRDVVVLPTVGTLFVSQLRSAKVFELAKSNGAILATTKAPPPANRLFSTTGMPARFESFAAYRMVRSSEKTVVLVHQAGAREQIEVDRPNAYGAGGGCNSVVNTAITSLAHRDEGMSASPNVMLDAAVAPTDIAVSPIGHRWLVVAAGNGHTKRLKQIFRGQRFTASSSPCVPNDPNVNKEADDPPGQVVAATFAPNEAIVAFTREPAGIHVLEYGASKWTSWLAGGESKEDTGHAIFHSNAGAGMACVSCHPEGGDDGRVWDLSSTGPRRTQSLRGTLAGTAPYHWGGDAKDMGVFARDVFANRMSGTALSEAQVAALDTWVTHIPAPNRAAATDVDAIARGKALFESSAVGCTNCHSGTMFTNNETVAVGTGGKFQVPSLIGVRTHGPFLHDGRAATLLERFDPAIGGGDEHGSTSGLSKESKADLVKYLETL